MATLYNIAHLELKDVNEKGDKLLNNINEGKKGIIMLKAGWCGHCKSSAPSFNKLAGHPNFFIATIDNDDKDVSNKVMKAFDVQGFPSYVLVGKDGKITGQYNGGRDTDSILKALNA